MTKHKLTPQELQKEIEKLLHFYQKSKLAEHQDIKFIAETYFASGDLQKRDMIKHYTINGSYLINAIFNNDTEKLEGLAEE